MPSRLKQSPHPAAGHFSCAGKLSDGRNSSALAGFARRCHKIGWTKAYTFGYMCMNFLELLKRTKMCYTGSAKHPNGWGFHENFQGDSRAGRASRAFYVQRPVGPAHLWVRKTTVTSPGLLESRELPGFCPELDRLWAFRPSNKPKIQGRTSKYRRSLRKGGSPVCHGENQGYVWGRGLKEEHHAV